MTGRPPLSRENGGEGGGTYKQLAAGESRGPWGWGHRRGGGSTVAESSSLGAGAATATPPGREDERALKAFWGGGSTVGRSPPNPLAVLHCA